MDWVACSPAPYRSSTDPARDETVDTYEAHQIYAAPPTGTLAAEFNSVSTTTYSIIPSLLGVTVDADKGVIAGTAFDCNDAAIEGATVQVTDAAGEVPADVIVKYFVEEFPDREQPYTSADGLWVAINVPEGVWQVRMFAMRDGASVLTGITELQIFASSINISNIYTGFGTGVKYPSECLLAE
jgi:hypothetical protein